MTTQIKQSEHIQLQLYEESNTNDEGIRAYEHNITLGLWRLTYHEFKIKTHYMALLEAVEDMISGLISPTLIMPSAINQLYDGKIIIYRALVFDWHFQNFDWFYKNVKFVALCENTKFFISQ